MDYPTVGISDAGAELDRLHKSIEGKLRSTVQDAIRAGEILTQVKGRLSHGDFLPWLQVNCSFSQRTAYNYIGVYSHSDKIASVANLQDAYQQIETIERQEKQTEAQRAQHRVNEYRRTGVKPDGWRRGTDDKLVDEEAARDKRIEEQKKKMQEAEEQRAKREKEYKERRAESDVEMDFLNQAADKIIQQGQKRQKFKERIRLSQSGESDVFIDALMDYLDELEDDNRRIEACTNIMKVCRNISNELQRDTK